MDPEKPVLIVNPRSGFFPRHRALIALSCMTSVAEARDVILGFREGGSTTNHGQLLQANGTYDAANTKKAVQLFQSLELLNGNSGVVVFSTTPSPAVDGPCGGSSPR